jgi:predicted nucleic acid-binding protein
MYLLDTNIFLEILLQRENSKAAKHLFIANPYTDLFVTDFSHYCDRIRSGRCSRSGRSLEKFPFGF